MGSDSHLFSKKYKSKKVNFYYVKSALWNATMKALSERKNSKPASVWHDAWGMRDGREVWNIDVDFKNSRKLLKGLHYWCLGGPVPINFICSAGLSFVRRWVRTLCLEWFFLITTLIPFIAQCTPCLYSRKMVDEKWPLKISCRFLCFVFSKKPFML